MIRVTEYVKLYNEVKDLCSRKQLSGIQSVMWLQKRSVKEVRKTVYTELKLN